MVFTLALSTVGFWAYGPLILKLLFDTKPLVTGYILAGEAIAWSVATMAVSRVTPADDQWVIRSGAVCIAIGAAGFAVAVPEGSLSGTVLCALLQGAGFGACWPAIVQRVVRLSEPADRALASSSVSTMQRIGYAVGTRGRGHRREPKRSFRQHLGHRGEDRGILGVRRLRAGADCGVDLRLAFHASHRRAGPEHSALTAKVPAKRTGNGCVPQRGEI